MVRWSSLAALCVVALLFAGCAADPGKTTTSAGPKGAVTAAPGTSHGAAAQPTATPTATSAAPQAVQSAAPVVIQAKGPAIDTTTAPWWLFESAATANATVSGYLWTVPKGAYHVDPDYPNESVMTMEFGFLGQPKLTAYSILMFTIAKDGNWEPYLERVAVPLEYTSKTTPVLATTTNQPVTTAPFWVRNYHYKGVTNDLNEGDTIGIVVTATGTGTASLALDLLDHAPKYDEKVPNAAQLSDLLARKGQGASMPVHGSGHGFSTEIYENFDFSLEAVGLFGATIKTAGMDVKDAYPTETLQPVVTARDLKATSSSGLSNGWSLAETFAYSSSGAGQLEYATTAFDKDATGTSQFVGTPEVNLAGYAGYIAVGNGAGTAATDVHATIADSDDFQELFIIQYAIGTPLETLLGGAAHTSSATLGLSPLAATNEGGNVVLTHGGFQLVTTLAAQE